MNKTLVLLVLAVSTLGLVACSPKATGAKVSTEAPPASKEQQFWAWFSASSERIFEFEKDQTAVFDELQQELNRVVSGLSFEFGPVQNGRRELAISADGIKERFLSVNRLVDAAPKLAKWQFTALRPRRALANVEIKVNGLKLSPRDVKFRAQKDGNQVALILFVPGLTTETYETLGSMAFLLLDQALGEYDTETKVGAIDFRNLAEAPADAQPMSELARVFDQMTVR
jgi:hypothetical protein